MNLFRVLFVIVAVAAAIQWWNARSQDKAMHVAMDAYGFLPVPMPPGAARDTVLIFTPLNCPKEAAQRALALSEELTRRGIPNARTDQYAAQAFENTEENHAAFRRLNFVMTGEIPIVLLKGLGKSNPSIDEVVAEYRRTR